MISCGLKIFLGWVCLGWFLIPLFSQQAFIRNYSQNEGLPTTLINTGLRSIDGHAWFGTPGGLFRYDGDVFHPFRIEDGLASNGIRKLLQRGKVLWIGTTAGLNRFDGQRMSSPLGNTNAMVTALAAYGEEIWFATIDGGIHAGRDDTFHRVPLAWEDGHVVDLLAHAGCLWALFSHPVRAAARRWDGNNWLDVPLPTDALQPRFLCPWAGELYVGSDRGLFPMSPGRKALLAGVCCTAAWVDGGGRLWVGTERDGVTIIEPGGRLHLKRENGLADNHVEAIFGDEEGLVWVCTGRGVSKVISLAYRGFLADLPVMAMAEYAGAMWFGTDEEGIWRREDKGEAFVRLGRTFGLPSENVRALAVFSGTLFAGTKAGLRQWDGRRFVPTRIESLNDEYILNLQVTNAGLWLSTVRRGLALWDGDRVEFFDTAGGLPSNTVWSVACRGETVWIGTEGGLCRLEPDRQLLQIDSRHGLNCDQIRGLLNDSTGDTFWAATGNGLYRLHKGIWKGFGRSEGLSSPHVSSLLEVGDDLWLGTEQGVFIYSKGRILRGATALTGLLGGEECSGVSSLVRSRSGSIWYLSTTGATEIDPSLMDPPKAMIPLYITGMRSGDTNLAFPPAAPLPRQKNDLTFSYRALALADERQVRYRTRLDGLDTDWSDPISAVTVRYTNLEGGTYTLRVQARRNDEDGWSPESSVTFGIEQAFHERGWVIALALLLFAGTSYFLGLGVKRALGAITFFRRVRYIGHFKILETLGSGGMGVVYKAADLQNSGRIVALKVLKNGSFSSESGKRRFQLEGSIIDQFDHPGIVHNFERGEIEGCLYIAMEYIDGAPLSQILRDGPLTVARAVDMMIQLLEVLYRLHQRGVLHRDLKPENLMVCRSDPSRIKLLDFGLAMRESQTRLTQTGAVMGTLHFLPPERILSGISTPKGDVYSTGVLFFEMLTGKRPFEGDGLLEVMKSIIDSRPMSLDFYRPDLPQELKDLLCAMMNRTPDCRPTAQEALIVLQQCCLAPK